MYTIKSTADFKKSYSKITQSGNFKDQARKKLFRAINILASGEKLPAEYKDHQLKGELSNYREFHIKGDLLLVYQIRKNELLLILIDIGTHSYLNL